jgi:hypothetical protein
MNNLEEIKNDEDNTQNNKFRPYSMNELSFLRKQMYIKMYLGDVRAYHNKCGHHYLVKKNGKKEQGMLRNNTCGYCSVCWKLSKTPENMLNYAENLFYDFSMYRSESPYLTLKDYENEKKFYTWLYSK